jgi:hypothetical protein
MLGGIGEERGREGCCRAANDGKWKTGLGVVEAPQLRKERGDGRMRMILRSRKENGSLYMGSGVLDMICSAMSNNSRIRCWGRGATKSVSP